MFFRKFLYAVEIRRQDLTVRSRQKSHLTVRLVVSPRQPWIYFCFELDSKGNDLLSALKRMGELISNSGEDEVWVMISGDPGRRHRREAERIRNMFADLLASYHESSEKGNSKERSAALITAMIERLSQPKP